MQEDILFFTNEIAQGIERIHFLQSEIEKQIALIPKLTSKTQLASLNNALSLKFYNHQEILNVKKKRGTLYIFF